MRTVAVETSIHGRVMLRDVETPAAVVLGFHGYTENAEIQMDRLLSMPGSDAWMLISVQGLHRFYRGRTETVVSSWMTRQDRELMIADNLAYARRVVDQFAPEGVPLFTVGFSQGVAMAFRAGVRLQRRADGIIAVGGDVPPELFDDTRVTFPRVLLTRGRTDDWYTASRMNHDLGELRLRNVDASALVYDGGHEWTPEVAAEAARVIQAAQPDLP